MGILYTIHPEDREPVDFTHYDCWEDNDTEQSIIESWSKTLGVKLPTDSLDSAILSLLRQGYDVYDGDSFIEIYDSVSEEV